VRAAAREQLQVNELGDPDVRADVRAYERTDNIGQDRATSATHTTAKKTNPARERSRRNPRERQLLGSLRAEGVSMPPRLRVPVLPAMASAAKPGCIDDEKTTQADTQENTMTGNSTEIAQFRAVGPGRMTVTEDETGFGYEFRITGRTNSLTISDDEAAELALAIPQRQGRR